MFETATLIQTGKIQEFPLVLMGRKQDPTGPSSREGPMAFCHTCHSVGRVKEFVFGNGTAIKVTRTMPPLRA